MTHIAHGDVHEVGLVEGCPGCEELAENPVANLDAAMIRQVVAQATAVPRDIPASYPQALAVKHVLDTLERVGRIATDAPDLLERYLRDRWHLRVRIEGKA